MIRSAGFTGETQTCATAGRRANTSNKAAASFRWRIMVSVFSRNHEARTVPEHRYLRVDVWLYKHHHYMMNFRVAGFEWDKGNRDKCQHHGVPRTAVEKLFHGPFALFPDPLHSDAEERFKGNWSCRRWAASSLVVFTLRSTENETLIRPISARYMHRKEIVYYEKAIAQTEK